ncbi:MAG: glucose-1-phosphate cytidylyltransferase [Rubricoccaceae bacterium]
MKVVLFCGGEGMRIREHSGALPKPMVHIGSRPILWHLMKYYAHFGHKDFILCLGHGAEYIKRYFVEYDETVSNDFVLGQGGEVRLLQSDLHDWRITFVDTGMDTLVGERLLAVRPFIGEDEWFLCNYADGVSDAPLDDVVAFAKARDATLTFLGVRPNYTSHVVEHTADGRVTALTHVTDLDVRINGGFFVAHRRLFDALGVGEDLMIEAAQTLSRRGELFTYAYDGFWACMDTFKEKRLLEDIHKTGHAPWEVWLRSPREFGDGALDLVDLDALGASVPERLR